MSEEKQKPEVAGETEGLKIKKKPGRPRKLIQKEEVTKINIKKEEPKKEEDAIQIGETKEVPVGESSKDSSEVDKQVRVESNKDDIKKEEIDSPIKEVSIEEVDEEKNHHIPPASQEKVEELPENVNKLVSFMRETNGTLEDYVRLNADYSNVNEEVLLKEYYKKTKPHLDEEEINFILEDSFYFDDEVEDERDIRKKKLAKKEEIAKARGFLEQTKEKYYDEIKLRKRNENPEMTKAMDFFNRHNQEQELNKQKAEDFRNRTNKYFTNDEFKGFDFNLGDKRFKYGVKDVDSLGNEQGNLNNFLRKFLDEKGQITNLKDYHKALYAATNADTIAKHFYDQGVADGTKNIIAKSKNIDNTPRPEGGGDVFVNGFKVKAISGVDSSKLKFKKRNKN